MKTNIFCVLLMIIAITLSCTSYQGEKTPNNLKSVSLWSDTSGIDPAALLASLERVNQTIDSIGYPEAGYKLWIVTEDSLEFRFMIEELWPSKEVYDMVNEDERYKNAMENYLDEAERELWNSLDMKWFSMFSRVE
jgi:hypothetical protein